MKKVTSRGHTENISTDKRKNMYFIEKYVAITTLQSKVHKRKGQGNELHKFKVKERTVLKCLYKQQFNGNKPKSQTNFILD